MKKKEFDKKYIDNQYNSNGESISNIAKKLGTTRITLRKWMVDNGFKIDNSRRKSNDEVKLTDLQEEVLFGGLLGDAHLSSTTKNPQLSYGSSENEHTKLFQSYFKNIVVNECKGGPKLKKTFDKRTNKTYISYQFRSILNKGLNKYRDLWYKDKIKIIPKKLELTPIVCLLWYLGDGSIQNIHKDKATALIKLSTNNFTFKEVNDILIPQLIKFEAYVGKHGNNQPVIRIPRRKINEFLNYIGECPIKCYKHKWLVYPYKYKKYE